jgi:hypothetical protein
MNFRVQQVSAAFGFVFTAVFIVGFLPLAHFLPPPSPEASGRQIAAMSTAHRTGIRIGMVLMCFAAALLLPWNAAVAVQMRRIEGPNCVLAYAQLAAGACVVIEFIYPFTYWLLTSFRPQQTAAIIQNNNDLAWLCFLGVVETAVLQCFALGVVTFLDKRERPVFPRWFGYFNIWMGTLFCPAGLIVFFKHGAFAWNGVISWWMVAAAFFVWMMTATIMLLKAINHQRDEEAAAPVPAPSELELQLAKLTATVEQQARRLDDLVPAPQ